MVDSDGRPWSWGIPKVEMKASTPIYPGDEIEIDFDVKVAKKEGVDLLRDVILEILTSLSQTGQPDITRYFGPACDKLLEEREEANHATGAYRIVGA